MVLTNRAVVGMWLALLLSFLPAIASCRVGGATSGDSAALTKVVQAQTEVHFRIRTPACLPANVSPIPTIEVRRDPSAPGFEGVRIEYRYRVRPTLGPGSLDPAVAINEYRNAGGDALIRVGPREVLDGLDVVVSTPPVAPGMQWIQDRTVFDLVTTLSWPDALAIYHSMVTGSSDCGQPRRT